MDRMLCTDCGAVSYSAAAIKLVESGERCPRCGAPLALDPDSPGVRSSAPEPPSPTART